MKTALITGIGGQDGSHIAEYLLSLGYSVHGIARSDMSRNTHLKKVWNRITMHYGDVRVADTIGKAIQKANPDEIYNLAGQVFVPLSWAMPVSTIDINTGGLVKILQFLEKNSSKCRVYQASTSEMFGNINGAIDENTPMHPLSPYGVSKLAAHELCSVYRKRGLFVCSGILCNHEGPRRGEEMVTRKITKAVAKWVMGDTSTLKLGDILSMRDWGFAGDYVKAMHAMLQHDVATDYVIGTGEAHSVKEFLQLSLEVAGLSVDEYLQKIEMDERFQRGNTNIDVIVANATKAKRILKWEPEHSFRDLVKMMVDEDIRLERIARNLNIS